MSGNLIIALSAAISLLGVIRVRWPVLPMRWRGTFAYMRVTRSRVTLGRGKCATSVISVSAIVTSGGDAEFQSDRLARESEEQGAVGGDRDQGDVIGACVRVIAKG